MARARKSVPLAALREKARGYTEQALQRVIGLITSPHTRSGDIIRASKILFDLAYGPPRVVEDAPVEPLADMTKEERIAALEAALAAERELP